MENLTHNLNPAQLEAVTAEPANILVLAGAGSGKTRVLVHRIAWLMQNKNASSFSILSVTFTNKAANEMRTRILQLAGPIANSMWIGTFHGLAHRFLRAHWKEAGLPQAFQILDSEDQARLIRRIMKSLNIDEERWPVKQVQWFINAKKDEGLRPQHIKDSFDPFSQTMLRIYQAYEETCQRGGLVDFAELLLRNLDLLRNNPALLHHYQIRFEHILVDEFQDTNAIQYQWLSLLAGKNSKVMIVGDDDQSIYSWRGAKVENIRRFQKEFSDTHTILLEQNYRSTGNILKAANALIDNNDDRLGKNLWTDFGSGDPISIYAAFNEVEEARFIADKIREWTDQGYRRTQVAILYRSNAQSRVLEEALIQAGIPYRIYGGMRFFERAEIKDALAYLRLIANPHDDPAFERVFNVPTRGIGERSIEAIREYARDKQLSLWTATSKVIAETLLPARASNALIQFVELINLLERETADASLDEITEHVLQRTGLLAHYEQMKGEKGDAKAENLGELISAAREFRSEEEGISPLSAFLSHAALEAGETQANPHEDCVQLMTLHSAKGLEFPLVFLAGVEEGLFPHQMSLDEPGRLEEERRLCYVGITRAMRQLFICYAESRRLYGKEFLHSPSRFIAELPSECLQEVRARGRITRPVNFEYDRPFKPYENNRFNSPFNNQSKPNSFRDKNFIPAPIKRIPVVEEDHQSGLRIGQNVNHAKFGKGVVLNLEGKGDHTRVQIKFSKAGIKWLMLNVARLEAC
jgi:DNA helicase-2/ATP-dependent DNA helicase PcrA